MKTNKAKCHIRYEAKGQYMIDTKKVSMKKQLEALLSNDDLATL